MDGDGGWDDGGASRWGKVDGMNLNARVAVMAKIRSLLWGMIHDGTTANYVDRIEFPIQTDSRSGEQCRTPSKCLQFPN